MFEATVVLIALLAQNLLNDHSAKELIATAAVFFGFMHAQVSSRMQEKESEKTVPDVECWKWSNRYFVAKEIFWIAFFIVSQSYSALIGCVIFAVYPIWRKYYRKFKKAGHQ